MDIRERIDNGEFKVLKGYPKRPKQPASSHITIANFLDEAPNDEGLCNLERVARDYLTYLRAIEEYKESLYEWHRAERFSISAFREALELEYNMKGHSKADAIWDKAWEEGHSIGLYEVVDEYEELLVLL